MVVCMTLVKLPIVVRVGPTALLYSLTWCWCKISNQYKLCWFTSILRVVPYRHSHTSIYSSYQDHVNKYTVIEEHWACGSPNFREPIGIFSLAKYNATFWMIIAKLLHVPDKNPVFKKSFALNIWLYLSLLVGVIVPYGPALEPKLAVSELALWTRAKPGPKAVWFPGPLWIEEFGDPELKPLATPTLNVEDKDVEGMLTVEEDPNDEPNTDEDDATARVWGGDWLTPDHEIPEVVGLWGSVIMPTFEKPLDTAGFGMGGWPQSVLGFVFCPRRNVLGMEVILRLLGSVVGNSIPLSLLWIRCTAMVNSCMVILPSRSRSDRFLQMSMKHV